MLSSSLVVRSLRSFVFALSFVGTLQGLLLAEEAAARPLTIEEQRALHILNSYIAAGCEDPASFELRSDISKIIYDDVETPHCSLSPSASEGVVDAPAEISASRAATAVQLSKE